MNSLATALRRFSMLLFMASATAFPTPAVSDVLSVILVKRHPGIPSLDPLDRTWSRVKPVAVAVYPQVSVLPRTATVGELSVNVRALHGGGNLALHLEWPDPKPARDRTIGAFADAAAIQWPMQYGPGKTLPYVGMGHVGAPVALWFWRADESVETLAVEGFGTLTPQPNDGVTARGVWKDGVWRLVFMRTLGTPAAEHRVRLDPTSHGLMPVAFAIWNGEAGERNGLKRFSAWHAIRFEKTRVNATYARVLAEPRLTGDANNGKRLLTERGCSGCHAFPDNPERPSVGPNLTYVGGIHSARYLLESLKEPSRIIVPGKLHTTVENGKRVSVMPPFAGSGEELRDIIAFLKTLR